MRIKKYHKTSKSTEFNIARFKITFMFGIAFGFHKEIDFYEKQKLMRRILEKLI